MNLSVPPAFLAAVTGFRSCGWLADLTKEIDIKVNACENEALKKFVSP